MGNIFGAKKKQKPKGAEVTQNDRVMLQIKNARDELQRYRKKVSVYLNST